MDQIWPNILINGAVVVLLWGLVLKSYHQRIDLVQNALERRVPEDYCRLQHRAITEDVAEIKRSQEKMTQTLEEIRLTLARQNGKQSARLEIEGDRT